MSRVGLVTVLTVALGASACATETSPGAPSQEETPGGVPTEIAPPPAFPARSVPAVLRDDGRFDILLEILGEASPFLLKFMSGPEFSSHTLFAPTDAAFGSLATGTLERLRAGGNEQELLDVVRSHVLPFRLASEDFERRRLETAFGARVLQMTVGPGDRVRVDDANVVEADIEASNGIIHAIDAVLAVDQPAG